MKLIINKYIIWLLTLPAILSVSCSNMLDLEPPRNQLTADKVFMDSASAVAATLQVYGSLAGVYSNLNRQLNVYVDDYVSNSANLAEFYQNQLTPENTAVSQMWNRFYSVIYQCNNILEQTRGEVRYSDALGSQLRSEALFLRSFCLYYLSTIFGEVPLIVSTDVERNAVAPRADIETISDQIVGDLITAMENLPTSYIGSGKVRANRWAAAALLARIYHDMGQWEEAELLANEVIGSGMYTPITEPQAVFKAGGTETIFEYWNANGFVPETPLVLTTSTTPPVFLSTQLVNSLSSGDLRKVAWTMEVVVVVNDAPVIYHLPYKYRNTITNLDAPEYLVALRCAEQYLIRAACRARRNNAAGAIEDINVIRARAGLPELESTADTDGLLDVVAIEWRKEMFGEWGNRFFRLKYNGLMDDVLEAVKPNWRRSVSHMFPIPQSEITYNKNLIQNEGY